MKISILMILYVFELLNCYLADYLCYGEKKVKYYLPVISMGTFFFIVFMGRQHDILLLYIIIFPMSLFVTVFSVETEKRFSKMLILFFILNSLDECVSMLFRLAGQRIGYGNIEENAEWLWESVITFLILVIAAGIKRKISASKRKKISDFIKKHIFAVAITMAVCMLFTVAELEYARNVITDNKRFFNIVFVLCFVSYISIGLVGVFSIYIKTVNERMEQMVKTEILLKEMQKHYYEQLLRREEDTRRYRHDMENHFVCLKNFASHGDVEKVLGYLEKMQETAVEIQKSCYFTGNEIIDVITNYYLPQIEGEAEISVSGKIQIEADEMNLCTIYANLLQNAIEELKRNENETPFLNINFLQGRKYVRITIENSLSEIQTVQKLENILETKKKDKLNHGIGLKNVKKAVKELGGTLEVRKSGKSFLAEVNLPVEK